MLALPVHCARQFAVPVSLLCASVCCVRLLAVCFCSRCASGAPAAVCHGRPSERMSRASGERICRSPSSQGTDSRSLSPSHRSAVWLWPRRGSPFAYAAHSRIRRSPGRVQSPSGPATTPTPAAIDTSIPSSSRNSRRRALSGSSPGSTLPPGNSHKPASSCGYERWAAKTRSPRGECAKIAAATMSADIPFTMSEGRSPCTTPRRRGLSRGTMPGTGKGRTMPEPWLDGHEPPACGRAVRAPTGCSGRAPNSPPERIRRLTGPPHGTTAAVL